MGARDRINFYRNAALRKTRRETERELRKRAVRGEELSREEPTQRREFPPVQLPMRFNGDRKP